jgi:hypothetical protein
VVGKEITVKKYVVRLSAEEPATILRAEKAATIMPHPNPPIREKQGISPDSSMSQGIVK